MGTIIDDRLTGSSGADVMFGYGGRDGLYGGDGADKIRGGAGEDFLFGEDGNDLLLGGTGFDVLIGGQGNDTLDGGSSGEANGVSFQEYTGVDAGVFVNLRTGKAVDAGGGTDTLLNISEVYGSGFDDVLLGGNRAYDDREYFVGDRGADTIDGRSGYDIADYTDFNFNSGIIADMLAGTVRDSYGDTDRIANIERIAGTFRSDFISGDHRRNDFELSFGADTVNGRGGLDSVDYTYDFQLATAANLRIRNPGIDADLRRGSVIDLGDQTDVLKSIENVTGSVLSDQVRGNHHANVLNGLAGEDVLNGRAGDDSLDGGLGGDDVFGGAGNDWIAGGSGNDFLRGARGADRFVFGENGDYDTINDFVSGTDKIDVRAFDFASKDAVLALAEQHGTSVVIDLDGDTAIEFVQTELSDLQSGDFLV